MKPRKAIQTTTTDLRRYVAVSRDAWMRRSQPGACVRLRVDDWDHPRGGGPLLPTRPQRTAASNRLSTSALRQLGRTGRLAIDVFFVYSVPTKATSMPTAVFLGEWEQLVLLAVLQLGDRAYALPLRGELEARLRRRVSRGALYRTLDRLEQKRYVAAKTTDEDVPVRGGHPRRRFVVTAKGIAALRASRNALIDFWSGLETVLE